LTWVRRRAMGSGGPRSLAFPILSADRPVVSSPAGNRTGCSSEGLKPPFTTPNANYQDTSLGRSDGATRGVKMQRQFRVVGSFSCCPDHDRSRTTVLIARTGTGRRPTVCGSRFSVDVVPEARDNGCHVIDR